MAYCFGLDTNQDPPEAWDRAKLRILVTFLSTGETRSVSNTFTAINTLYHQATGNTEDVFVDVCYLPEAETREAFIKDGIPFMFGNVSHRSWEEYDVIGVSQAIMPEVLNVLWMFNNSSFPPTCEARDKANAPLVLYGGAAAICAIPCLAGATPEGKGLFDLGMVGAGEPILPLLTRLLVEAKDKFGSIKEHREETRKYVLSDTYIRQHVVVPTDYDVEFKEDNVTIKEIHYLDPDTPKKVLINHVDESPRLGFQNKIFNVSGENATSADVQISTGCSGGGAPCSFNRPGFSRIPTDQGLIRLEDAVDKTYNTEKFVSHDPNSQCTAVKRVPDQRLYKITLSDGQVTYAGEHHRTITINWNTFEEQVKYVENLRPGDSQLVKLHVSNFGPQQTINGVPVTETLAYLAGSFRARGNGYFDGDSFIISLPLKEMSRLKSSLEETFTNRSVQEGEKYQTLRIDNVKPLLEPFLLVKDPISLVPDIIFRSPKATIVAYLKGLFQSKGYITKSGTALTDYSRTFLNDVQLLLRMLGIFSKLNEKKNPKTDQTLYVLYINGEFSVNLRTILDLPHEGEPELKHLRVVPCTTLRYIARSFKKSQEQTEIRDQLNGGRLTLKSLKTLYESGLTLPRVYQAIAEGNYYPVTVVSVEPMDTVVPMYSTNVEPYHRMCYDLIYEHNCLEANEANGWRELPFDEFQDVVQKTKRMAAPNTMSMFSFNCLSGDTLIQTDKGTYPISSLVGREDITFVYSMCGPTKFQAIVQTGVKPTLRIQVEDGEALECSPEHKVAVWRGTEFLFVEAKNLQVGDQLILSKPEVQEDREWSKNHTFSPIKTIQSLGEQMMYDIIGTEVGCYTANGIEVHNSNYYYRYIDALNELAKNSSNLSLINMRTDSVGADPEYTAVAKRLGLKRIGMAVEGMSERIRNHIFNKNLPRDLWMAAVRVAFENKLILLKHGSIMPWVNLTQYGIS